jgi:UDP-N-acetylmuramyl tripeptide synthase
VQVQADRATAIDESIASAAASDVVLIAGKGHEEYQEIRGVKLPFSDRERAQAALLKYAQRNSHPLPFAGEGRGEGEV